MSATPPEDEDDEQPSTDSNDQELAKVLAEHLYEVIEELASQSGVEPMAVIQELVQVQQAGGPVEQARGSGLSLDTLEQQFQERQERVSPGARNPDKSLKKQIEEKEEQLFGGVSTVDYGGDDR
jgi:hypothetical protein